MATEDEGLRLRPIRTKTTSTAIGWERGDAQEMEPVTPAGRMFLQPNMNCYVVCTMGFKNSVDVPTFKKGLQETLVQHKRFSSIMKKDKHGFDYWVRTQVNIDDHVILPPASALDAESSRKVETYAASLASAPPLDPARPLWEFHILNVESATATASCIFRLHHSLGDGISMMSLFLAATQTVASPHSLPSTQPLAMRTQKSNQTRDQGSIKNYISFFWRNFTILWCTIVEVVKFLLLLLFLQDSQTPLKGSPGVEFMAKSINTATIALDDMRTVKNAVGGTINDVFLGIVSCGIRRYLEQHVDKLSLHHPKHEGKFSRNGCMEASETKINRQQKCIDALRIRASSMVNTRPQPGLQEVAKLMKGGSQAWWGNNIAYIVTPILTRHCSDPLDYVRKAKEVTTRKKFSLEANFIYKSGQLIMKLAGAKAAADLMYRAVVHTTLSLSNIVGPLEEVMFMGNPITEIVPTSYGQPQSSCIHLQSYMGKVKLVLTVAKDVIPDPDILLQHIVGALKDMKEEASARFH